MRSCEMLWLHLGFFCRVARVPVSFFYQFLTANYLLTPHGLLGVAPARRSRRNATAALLLVKVYQR